MQHPAFLRSRQYLLPALAGKALDVDPDARRLGEAVVRIGVRPGRAVMVHDPVEPPALLLDVRQENGPAEADDALVAGAPAAGLRSLFYLPQQVHLEADPVVLPEDL